MISPRRAIRALRALGGLCAVALSGCASAAPHPAFAQGRLDAQYEATLAGIPVGRGAWTIDIADDQFSASASGGTAGLLKAFAAGSGTGAAQGRVVNGALVSTNYTASTTHVEEDRSHPHGARQRHHQGISRSSRNRRSIPTAFR